MLRIAAITMVYNEPEYLPIWLRHHARHVGLENCYVVDHGSTDGSTDDLGDAVVIRLPRSPQDDWWRADLISRFARYLLTYHDWVLYSDVDELLVPDPAAHEDLRAFCDQAPAPVMNAIGFNVVHMPEEADIDTQRPISAQRSWAYMLGPMCKPLLTRRPVAWTPGFHRCEADCTFGDLYLFHLRPFDRAIGLRRMARTREHAWAEGREPAWWQQLGDDDYRAFLAREASRPRATVAFSPKGYEVREVLGRVLGSPGLLRTDPNTFELNAESNALWRLPDRFVGTF